MYRLRNCGLWVSILAFIPMVLEAFNVHILPENYEDLVKALLGILVLAGILNDPTTKCRGYMDDKKKEK